MKYLLLSLAVLLASCASTPTVQTGPDAEVTPDGLHKVDNTYLAQVFIAPEIDLSQYEKIQIKSLGIEYRFVKDKGRFYRAYDDEFPLDEDQKERISETVREAFTDEFSEIRNYSFTDQPGKRTLTLLIGMADVVSHVPPEPMGRGDIYISELGTATLVVEIRDSRSNEVLARILDRRTFEPGMGAMESNPVTNYSELKRELRFWAQSLRDGLDELHDRGCFVCTQAEPTG